MHSAFKFYAILTLAEKVQIMDRERDTPDLNHRQPVVKESCIFSCLLVIISRQHYLFFFREHSLDK